MKILVPKLATRATASLTATTLISAATNYSVVEQCTWCLNKNISNIFVNSTEQTTAIFNNFSTYSTYDKHQIVSKLDQ